MKLSELTTALNVQSDVLDDIAKRIGAGGTDPEVSTDAAAAVNRLTNSVQAVNALVAQTTPPSP